MTLTALWHHPDVAPHQLHVERAEPEVAWPLVHGAAAAAGAPATWTARTTSRRFVRAAHAPSLRLVRPARAAEHSIP